MRPSARDPLFASSPEPSLEESRQLFLAACLNSGDGSTPNIEAFLAPFDEPERSSLRAELEELQRSHVRRPAGSASGDVAARGTKSDVTAETRHNAPIRVEPVTSPDGTVEHVAAPDDTIEHATAPDGVADRALASDGTIDHAPLSDGTIDHATAPDGTVDHVSAPDQTGDHVSAPDETTDHEPRVKSSGKTPIPQSVAGYEILGVLGRGAMGVVYKARQRGLKRLVALKMILSGEHASEQDLGRFRAEANAVAQLHHAGIVQIYEVGEDGDRPFFSLEFVDGVSLHKKLQGPPLPPKVIADLLRQMAEAMHYAHQRGVIHRDLKPANVLMTSDGIPKIGDFGLAKTIDEDESGLTRTGTVLGTPSYMSPEQAGGLTHEIGPLADVYSLGAILYDMLTGRPPFRGTSVMDTLQQLRTREPVPPMQLQPEVPRDLETICLKCLQKDRTKRYADAGALAADLQRFLKGEPILARPISWVERQWRWCQRNPGKASTGAAVLLGLVAWAISVSVLAVNLDVQKKEAVQAKGEAIEAKNDAEEKKAEAIHQKGIAEEKTVIAIQNAEGQRQVSKESLLGFFNLFNKIYDVMQSKRLSVDASPEIRKLRADLLADVQKQLGDVTKKINAVATATYADLLEAELMGAMLMKLGRSQEPRAIYEKALESAKKRVEREPNNDKARANMGIMEQRLGDVALNVELDARTARSHFLTSRKLHEEIQRQPRSGDYTPLQINLVLAHDDVRLGKSLVALGQATEARTYFQEALGYFGDWLNVTPAEPKDLRGEPLSYIMEVRMWLGIASGRLGDVKGVEEQFTEALAIGNSLLKDLPHAVSYKADQAEVQGAYGDALLRLGKNAEARKNYLDSLNTLKAFFVNRPDNTTYQPLMALTHERLGIVSALMKQEQEAKQYYKQAVELHKALYEVEKSNLSRQIGYVLALAHSGNRVDAVPNLNAIAPRMVKSPELMLNVSRSYAILAADNTPDRKKYVEQMLAALKVATKDDYKDAVVLETDPDLATLREEAGFKELIAKIKTR